MGFRSSKGGAAGRPPPPPPPPSTKAANSIAIPRRPNVAANGPRGAFMVELVTYSGAPFKDHWAYFIRSHQNPQVGVFIHATGDVRNGFVLEFRRSYDFDLTATGPTARIPLQWVDVRHFDETAMLNNNTHKTDHGPVCAFEASANKIKAPGKTLNSIDANVCLQFTYCIFSSRTCTQLWYVQYFGNM